MACSINDNSRGAESRSSCCTCNTSDGYSGCEGGCSRGCGCCYPVQQTIQESGLSVTLLMFAGHNLFIIGVSRTEMYFLVIISSFFIILPFICFFRRLNTERLLIIRVNQSWQNSSLLLSSSTSCSGTSSSRVTYGGGQEGGGGRWGAEYQVVSIQTHLGNTYVTRNSRGFLVAWACTWLKV